jgi:hypothetical protein
VVFRDVVLIWGGYNGKWLVHYKASLWLGTVDDSKDEPVSSKSAPEDHSKEHKRLQEWWQAKVLVRESDLPADVLAQAQQRTLLGRFSRPFIGMLFP